MTTLRFSMIIAAFMLFTSCYTVGYFGDKLPPTEHTDIYYSAKDVKRAHKVLGHMTYPSVGQKTVTAKLSNYARSIGADAIIIFGTENSSAHDNDVVKADAIKYTSEN